MLAKLMQQQQYELRVTDGRLDGPAARWLREEASKAQFVFLGEEHDTHEIPIITGALWRELVPLRFRHVAIEAGQWLGGRLDRVARFNDQQALAQFQAAALPRRRNISVPPASHEDLEFYAGLGQPFSAQLRQRQPLIWGLDHEFKATPLLQRLRELAPAQRQLITALLSKVERAEQAGEYNLQPFKSEITALIDAFPKQASTERAQILDAMKRRVYGSRYDQERGDVFKQLFLRNYRAAKAAGEAQPRVLLRFGFYHAKRGLMLEFGTSTLANFVAELAATEQTQMLNVMVIACSLTSTDDWRAPKSYPRPCSPRERVWLPAFHQASSHPWTLFDLRGLRREIAGGRFTAQHELAEIAFGFDAVLMLKESAPARFSP